MGHCATLILDRISVLPSLLIWVRQSCFLIRFLLELSELDRVLGPVQLLYIPQLEQRQLLSWFILYLIIIYYASELLFTFSMSRMNFAVWSVVKNDLSFVMHPSIFDDSLKRFFFRSSNPSMMLLVSKSRQSLLLELLLLLKDLDLLLL